MGPAFLIIFLGVPELEGLTSTAWRVSGVALWMANWWATEAVPITVTTLLPIILFPLLDITSIKGAKAPYASPIVYLFMAGLIIAKAIENCGLHVRIALTILRLAGNRSHVIIGGFMIAAASLSIWIGNTSTAMMLLPIGLSIISVMGTVLPKLDEKQKCNFQMAMLLGIAYGASINGVGTLVGTPPNAFFAGFMLSSYGLEISFTRWLMVGIPLMA